MRLLSIGHLSYIKVKYWLIFVLYYDVVCYIIQISPAYMAQRARLKAVYSPAINNLARSVTLHATKNHGMYGCFYLLLIMVR